MQPYKFEKLSNFLNITKNDYNEISELYKRDKRKGDNKHHILNLLYYYIYIGADIELAMKECGFKLYNEESEIDEMMKFVRKYNHVEFNEFVKKLDNC